MFVIWINFICIDLQCAMDMDSKGAECAGNWVRGRGGSKLWLFFSISNFIFSFPVRKTDRLKKKSLPPTFT